MVESVDEVELFGGGIPAGDGAVTMDGGDGVGGDGDGVGGDGDGDVGGGGDGRGGGGVEGGGWGLGELAAEGFPIVKVHASPHRYGPSVPAMPRSLSQLQQDMSLGQSSSVKHSYGAEKQLESIDIMLRRPNEVCGPLSRSADIRRHSVYSSFVRFGKCAMSNASAALTIGVADEVPDIHKYFVVSPE